MSSRRTLALVALLGLPLGGCFEPAQPAVGFLCGPGGACPEGYECRETGCCHQIGSPPAECPGGEVVIDASTDDAALVDAAVVDAAVVDAMPADAMPADAMPVDAMPADAMPADAMPADAGGGDAGAADGGGAPGSL